MRHDFTGHLQPLAHESGTLCWLHWEL